MELVVKVQYQGTLRRLKLLLNEDGSLPITLEGLTTQIRHLFNFATDAHVAIAYTDEDHDVVTMATDVDLQDAVRQGLNPLRLDVSLAAPAVSSPRSSTWDGRTQGWDAMREAVRMLADPTSPLMRYARRPAVDYVLPNLEFAEGLIRVATTELGSALEGLAGQARGSTTASGTNM